MRKILLVTMMAFVVLSGCGKEETKEVTQSNVTYSYEEETLKALEKLSQNTVQQMDGDMESLKKKYSEWFDSNGDVCYPITPDSKK